MMSSLSANNNGAKAVPTSRVTIAYAVFLGLAGGVYHFIANGEFSAILTMAEMLQCFALVMLAVQMLSNHSAAGISASSLALEAAALCCRLSSTTWLNGYLPMDASGDWFYQAVDVCALLACAWLLRSMLTTYRYSYQATEDSFPITPIALLAGVCAALFHADMNARPLFDALWMAGLNLGVVAVLPQLWLITRSGGKVEAVTSHYIAMMAFGRILSGVFMWHARFDITCAFWVQGYNHAVWAILGAHAIHLLLLGDFAFVYFRTVMTQGLQAGLDLEGCADLV